MYFQLPNATPAVANILLPDFFDELNYQERQNQKIVSQIELAFQKPPTKANLLQGERLIKQGSKGRRTALFPSRKAKGTVALESQLELAHAISLERNKNVINYRTQAIRIQLPGNSWYFPDFIVLTALGHYEVHEVKPDIFHLTEKIVRKLKAVEKILYSVGITFRIIDSSTLPSTILTNKLLYVYARGHVQQWTTSQIALSIKLINSNQIHRLIDGYTLLQKNDISPQILEFLIFHELVNLPIIKKSVFSEGV